MYQQRFVVFFTVIVLREFAKKKDEGERRTIGPQSHSPSMANGKQGIGNKQSHPRRFSVSSLKTVTAICLGATLCTAQTINISGVVQDSGGVGLVGATVKLEKANLSATSGAGGECSHLPEVRQQSRVQH